MSLSNLSIDIFIIKKIFEFPFDIFCSDQNKIFFSRVGWNFYVNSILTVTKLTTDQKGKLYTLPQFKNWVYKQIKIRYESDFKNWLKKSKFDSKTKRVLEKAEKLRNEIFAHFDKHPLLGMGKLEYLDIKELEQLKNRLNSLFDALTFDVEHKMLPLSYIENVIHAIGVDQRSDIEVLLDYVAKNSVLLNMPEDSPDLWKDIKEGYDEDKMKIINKYRKKFNLPEI